MADENSQAPEETGAAQAAERTPAAAGGRVFARLYGEPLTELPDGLYIPPDALEVILDRFEGPLDLLLWLIRSQKFDVMDIPMAKLTEQYMAYVELIRRTNLELASAYLVMSATLMSIKSRMLLPKRPDAVTGEEPEDPRAELARRLIEYEMMREAARELNDMPRLGRDFLVSTGTWETPVRERPTITPDDLSVAWEAVEALLALTAHHHVTREELSVREHMSGILKRLKDREFIRLDELWGAGADRGQVTVWLLATLELGKIFLVRIQQAEPYAAVYLSTETEAALEMEEAGALPAAGGDRDPEADLDAFFEGGGISGSSGSLF